MTEKSQKNKYGRQKTMNFFEKQGDDEKYIDLMVIYAPERSL